jgi:hypothetical protein
MANQGVKIQDVKRLVDLRPDLPKEQVANAVSAVVVHPELPQMIKLGTALPAPQSTNKLPQMGQGPAPPQGARMAEVPATHPPDVNMQNLKPQEAHPAAATPGESYVRLTVHSENGVLSVVDAHEVAGPVAIPGAVAHGLVYEAQINDQQVALGSIPDAGVQRSFANRDVPGKEGKHGIATRTSFDFHVRVPKAHLTATALPQLHIVLHEVKEAPDRLLTGDLLAKQPGVVTTEVGRLAGIRLQEVAAEARPRLQKILNLPQ